MMKKILLSIILLLTSLATSAETIRLIVPFSQGGNADQLARLIQKTLIQDLNKTVVVEYHPGASGEIGTAVVANSDPRELVLLLNGPSIITTSLTKDKLSYNEANLTPLVHMGYVPFVLVVSKKSGIRSFKDLQNLDSQRPITYGSSGVLTATHLAAISLQQQLGKNFIHVPYKGSGQAIPDLIGGNLDALIIHWTAVDQFIKSDQITALAIETDQRLSQLPDVPTFKEFGIENSGKHGYLVLFSNANTNKVLQNQIKQSLNKLINDPSKSNPYVDMGFVKAKKPLQLQDYFSTEKQRYSKIVQNVTVDR